MEILFGIGIYMLISSAFMIMYVWVQNIRKANSQYAKNRMDTDPPDNSKNSSY